MIGMTGVIWCQDMPHRRDICTYICVVYTYMYVYMYIQISLCSCLSQSCVSRTSKQNMRFNDSSCNLLQDTKHLRMVLSKLDIGTKERLLSELKQKVETVKAYKDGIRELEREITGI